MYSIHLFINCVKYSKFLTNKHVINQLFYTKISTINIQLRNLTRHTNVTKIKKSTTMDCKETNLAVFTGKPDRYNGILIDSTKEYCDISKFATKLTDSLKLWTENNKRGIWFKVATEHADWIPELTKNGFNFHHAKENFVMLYKWLPVDEIVNIPSYAHTMLGVGAVVVNKKNELLVVKEKYFIAKPHWKLPGGYVHPGEEIADAAIREVLEETNIQTKFISMLALRHTHGTAFNCSDIYTIINLEPLTDNIVKCSRELTDCEWMNIDEFLKSENVTEANKFFVQKYLEYKKNNIIIDMKKGVHPILDKNYIVFSVTNKE